jgi:hypothetical protein
MKPPMLTQKLYGAKNLVHMLTLLCMTFQKNMHPVMYHSHRGADHIQEIMSRRPTRPPWLTNSLNGATNPI